jgi:hypothetical protein
MILMKCSENLSWQEMTHRHTRRSRSEGSKSSPLLRDFTPEVEVGDIIGATGIRIVLWAADDEDLFSDCSCCELVRWDGVGAGVEVFNHVLHPCDGVGCAVDDCNEIECSHVRQERHPEKFSMSAHLLKLKEMMRTLE